MPRRDDIKRILILGSGPIVIGQAAEFDYSGAQACKVLLEEGYEVVLVNSNPATIMTDPEFATRTYIEPLTPASVAKVIEREQPDALLPTLGGGTALDLARQLSEDGTLGKHRVELIGADYDAIRRAEDRELFRATMERAGLRVPRSAAVKSMREAARPPPRCRRWASPPSCGPASRWAAPAAASPGPSPSTGRWWPRASPRARSGRCSWRSR
jgi:carbamoyl-phosphate synthase large subunit